MSTCTLVCNLGQKKFKKYFLTWAVMILYMHLVILMCMENYSYNIIILLFGMLINYALDYQLCLL